MGYRRQKKVYGLEFRANAITYFWKAIDLQISNSYDKCESVAQRHFDIINT